MKEDEFIPYIDVLIKQIWFTILISLSLLLFAIEEKNNLGNIFFVIDIVFSFFGFLLIVLSLFYFWNAPIIVNELGIKKRINGKYLLFLWDDIVDVTIVCKPLIDHYRLVLVSIYGVKISFYPNKSIDKKILLFCTNASLCYKYTEARKNLNL